MEEQRMVGYNEVPLNAMIRTEAQGVRCVPLLRSGAIVSLLLSALLLSACQRNHTPVGGASTKAPTDPAYTQQLDPNVPGDKGAE